jgi:4'-phosphopantetheinyl transferase EntD
MEDRIESRPRRAALTRREFTLDAALAILAGCVITVSDTACSKNTVQPTPAPVAPADVTGSISANHGHAATITGAQIAAGGAISLDIRSSASHPHTLAISQAELATLKNRQPITSVSSTDNGHSHSVTFTPA